jgi:glycosyltransferase involved in cell wall biosynthesis
MKNPLVSIVIPCWNRQTFIPECIRSIQRQTYQNFEVILVDDGSEDDSQLLYDFYTKKDKRIKVVYTQHGGIAKARNAGIKEAKGDFIAVFDSDDVMMPERLVEEVKMMKKYDFCSSWYLSSNKELDKGATVLIDTVDKVTYEDVKNNRAWPHFMIMAHRKCFIENPYREDFVVNDDSGLVWDWFKAGYTNTIIKKPLGIQRGHSGNSSKTRLAELAKVQETLNKEYEKWEQSST